MQAPYHRQRHRRNLNAQRVRPTYTTDAALTGSIRAWDKARRINDQLLRGYWPRNISSELEGAHGGCEEDAHFPGKSTRGPNKAPSAMFSSKVSTPSSDMRRHRGRLGNSWACALGVTVRLHARSISRPCDSETLF